MNSTLGRVDHRLTVIKPGYGVNFDRVDHVIVDGGTSFYIHTWSIPWPQVRLAEMPLFDCSLATNCGKRCTAINTYIRETNMLAYELMTMSLQLLDKGKINATN